MYQDQGKENPMNIQELTSSIKLLLCTLAFFLICFLSIQDITQELAEPYDIELEEEQKNIMGFGTKNRDKQEILIATSPFYVARYIQNLKLSQNIMRYINQHITYLSWIKYIESCRAPPHC